MKISERVDLAVDRLKRTGVAFKKIGAAPWIDEIETKIGGSLPESYRMLVTRYSFPEFHLGPIELFSNLGDQSYYDLSIAPFRDPLISEWCIRAGYFQFGRPISGSYDPICFNLKQATSNKIPAAVFQIEHEAILCEMPTVEIKKIADSFLSLLEIND